MKMERIYHALDEIAGQAVPDNLNLWPELRSRLERDRRRPARLALGLSTLALVIIVGFALLAIGGSPRAGVPSVLQVTPTLTARTSALKSYRGVITGRLRMSSPDNRTGDQPYGFLDWQSYVWYQAPDNLRTEIFQPCTKVPLVASNANAIARARAQGSRVEFSGPTLGFCLLPDTINIRTRAGFLQVDTLETTPNLRYSNEPKTTFLGSWLAVGESALIPNKTDLETVKQEYSFAESIELIGTEMIVGRPAYVLDIKEKQPADSPTNELYEVRRVVWIDQETLIPLAAQSLAKNGSLLSSWAFTSFETNPDLDPGIFRYIPASDVKVYFLGLLGLWQELTRQDAFPVLTPGGFEISSVFFSSKLIPDRPTYDRANGVIEQTYLSRTDYKNTTIVLRIIEGSPSAVTALVGSGLQGERINKGDWTGYYGEQNGVRLLILNRYGTQIALQGQNEITKDDLIKIAESLQYTEAAGVVPEGMRAVSVSGNQLVSDNSQNLQAGDEVNLVIVFEVVDTPTAPEPAGTRQASVTIPATVLHIGPFPFSDPKARTQEPTLPSLLNEAMVVTFVVKPQDAQVLAWAVEAKLTIKVMPRYP